MKKYKILSVKTQEAVSSDQAFWAAQKPDDRVAAVEILRAQWYKMRNERPKRLRRVLQVIKSRKG